MPKLTPWQRIDRAAAAGTGLVLTPAEVQLLGMDQALTRAENDDIEMDTDDDN